MSDSDKCLIFYISKTTKSKTSEKFKKHQYNQLLTNNSTRKLPGDIQDDVK